MEPWLPGKKRQSGVFPLSQSLHDSSSIGHKKSQILCTFIIPHKSQAADNPIVAEPVSEEMLNIPLERIGLNPFNPQAFWRVKDHRVVQIHRKPRWFNPWCRVHPELSGHYQLVAGERRLRALKMLDYQEIPVLIGNIKDHDLLETALLENIQRENLTPMEEARSYQTFSRNGYTQDKLAERIGKDRTTISNLIRLLQLRNPFKMMWNWEWLQVMPSAGFPSIWRPGANSGNLLQQEWSVRETEKRVRQILENSPRPASRKVWTDLQKKRNRCCQPEEDLQQQLAFYGLASVIQEKRVKSAFIIKTSTSSTVSTPSSNHADRIRSWHKAV